MRTLFTICISTFLAVIGALVAAVAVYAGCGKIARISQDAAAHYLIAPLWLIAIPAGIAAGVFCGIFIGKNFDWASLTAQLYDANASESSAVSQAEISDTCTACGAEIAFPAGSFGTSQRCPHCNELVDVGAGQWMQDARDDLPIDQAEADEQTDGPERRIGASVMED